jgi:hypothetical protein
MIKLSDNNKKCWWCGNTADSREHRHKKSDFKRVFGRGNYDPELIPTIERDGELITVQGPNSDFLKFDKVICINCNSTRSQPFDLAYDIFIKYVEENKDEIINTRLLDFNKVFRTNALEQKQNVIKYYIKNISCRLAANRFSISKDVIDFLDGKRNLNHFYIKHEIRLDILWWIERIRKVMPDPGNLYIGPLRYYKKNSSEDIDVVYSFYNYRWFKMIYFYSDRITNEMYPGYDDYNNQLLVPIESLYLVEKEYYETMTDEELEQVSKEVEPYNDNDLLDDNLGINPFKN